MVATVRTGRASVDVDDPEDQQKDQGADEGYEYRTAAPEPVGEEEHRSGLAPAAGAEGPEGVVEAFEREEAEQGREHAPSLLGVSWACAHT